METLRETQRDEFLVTMDQLGDRALGDRHAPLLQLAMDLGHGAMIRIATGANGGNHVEAELAVRER